MNNNNMNVSGAEIRDCVSRMKKQVAYMETHLDTICKPYCVLERNLCKKYLNLAEVKVAEASSFIDGISSAIKNRNFLE